MNIVIADSVVRGVLSPERQFHGVRSNLGAGEIARLMGRGRSYGEGPLPRLLKAAAGSPDTGLILLREEGPEEGPGAPGAGMLSEWVDPLVDVLSAAAVVPCPPGRIAWRQLAEAIAETAAVDLAEVQSGVADISFLVVGCHTEKRVQTIAMFLRVILGFERVAVCPHLVGSATSDAHFATLRHNLPHSGVEVVLDLESAAGWAGIDPQRLDGARGRPCSIEPEGARSQMSEDAQRIIQLLCMHWTRTHLRALAGGFSGSLLFLADGWKGEARTEPMVIKIDDFGQMRRELDGYHQVKDLLGKHVPTFGYPVVEGELLGVGMELAAMEGRPMTLQDHFEQADTEAAVRHFLSRFEKSLDLLIGRLYRNTLEASTVAPFRAFGLQSELQLTWLRENGEIILGYLSEAGVSGEATDLDQLENVVRLVARNPDSVLAEVCLQHGDLNLANVICDDGDNVWFIDWTHCAVHPVELDFAKLENDVKFVMSKAFDLEDLPRLRLFEEYLQSQRIPSATDELPDSLKFAKWDLRFRKILSAVRLIRQKCFSLKAQDEWLLYRVALLRYALHTLSFDKRRDRGECDETQLAYALSSCESIALNLVADDFHLKIRAERPASYPPRQRISIDESLWVLDCEGYQPPYHVDPRVLAAGRDRDPNGWADPEEVAPDILNERPARHRDDQGRPLNPRGRTGLAGRGLLGLWGANSAVLGVVFRVSSLTGDLELLLGSRDGEAHLELPRGFLFPDEEPERGLLRVMASEAGWTPAGGIVPLHQGYAYDPRQTDHAWVEVQEFLLDGQEGTVPDLFEPEGDFEEVGWWTVNAPTLNRIPPGQAEAVQRGLARALEEGRVAAKLAGPLVSRAG